MARFSDQSKLLQILSETPLIYFACKKVGIHPTTYYRWHKSNKDFRDKVDAILSIGRSNVSDVMEAEIMKLAKAGNLRAMMFMLQYNNPRYRPIRTAYVEPTIHSHALKPGETCYSCGFHEPVIEPYNNKKKGRKDNKTLVKELHKRLRVKGIEKKNEEEINQIIEDFVKANNMTNEITFVNFGKKKKKNKNKKDPEDLIE